MRRLVHIHVPRISFLWGGGKTLFPYMQRFLNFRGNERNLNLLILLYVNTEKKITNHASTAHWHFFFSISELRQKALVLKVPWQPAYKLVATFNQFQRFVKSAAQYLIVVACPGLRNCHNETAARDGGFLCEVDESLPRFWVWIGVVDHHSLVLRQGCGCHGDALLPGAQSITIHVGVAGC